MADDDPCLWQLGLPDVSDEHVVAYALRGSGVRVHTCPTEQFMR